MRAWIGAVVVLTGCEGTILTQLETGYEAAPHGGGALHGGALAGHIGGSTSQGYGIGATLKTRAWTGGWAFPELGPHVFVMYENDDQVAFYARLAITGGLSGVNGTIGPMFSGELTPGLIFYPSSDPLGLTLSAVVESSVAPVTGDFFAFFGFRVGFAIGGMQD